MVAGSLIEATLTLGIKKRKSFALFTPLARRQPGCRETKKHRPVFSTSRCRSQPKFKFIMKTFALLTIALFLAVASHAQPTTPTSPVTAADPANDLVNYVIRVEWKDSKNDPKSLEVTTTPGQFQLDTMEKRFRENK